MINNDICGTCGLENNKCQCASAGDGAKFDADKPRWSLLPFREVKEIVEILTLGANKYADDNWKNVPNGKDRYFSAMIRHIASWKTGELTDKETGKSHLAHAGCCLLFLMWLDNE